MYLYEYILQVEVYLQENKKEKIKKKYIRVHCTVFLRGRAPGVASSSIAPPA